MYKWREGLEEGMDSVFFIKGGGRESGRDVGDLVDGLERVEDILLFLFLIVF